MNTATPKRSLRSLEKQLQQCLDTHRLENFPIQVKCAIKNADLLILAEHEDGVRPNLQQTFKAIHQAILSLSPQLGGELRLYLRVLGQVQPYAYHGFKLPQPLGAVKSPGSDSNPFAAWTWLEKLIEHHGESGRAGSEELLKVELSSDVLSSNSSSLTLTEKENEIESAELSALEGIESFPSSWFNQPDAARDLHEQTVKFQKLPTFWSQVSASLFLSVAICSVGLYGFTRPCVVGPCETIAQAEKLIEEGQQTLTQAQYAQQLQQVQEKFSLATQQLEKIPVWSGKRWQARQLMNEYKGEEKYLDEALLAMELGAKASQKAKTQPLRLEAWQDIEANWSSAIARWERISSQSQLYPLAQQKLSEYQASLRAIARRIVVEENAAQTLETIRANSDLAYTRQGVATTLESWQRVSQLWEQTLELSDKIPQQTMAYAQLQELIGDYRRELANARERQIQEKIAQDAYDRAIASAEEAKKLSEEKQWAIALNRWLDALTYIRQVPDNTFYYPKAQSLIDRYNEARTQAAAKFKTFTLIEKTQTDLKKLCSGKPVVCEYTVTEEAINVWLTADYVRQVKRTALLADQKGDQNALVGVDRHLDALKVALQSIGDNAQIPLMLYDSYGALIGRHPKT